MNTDSAIHRPEKKRSEKESSIPQENEYKNCRMPFGSCADLQDWILPADRPADPELFQLIAPNELSQFVMNKKNEEIEM